MLAATSRRPASGVACWRSCWSRTHTHSDVLREAQDLVPDVRILALRQEQLLERPLRLKFGELPDAVQARLAQADEATLLAWLERVLSATSLEDVLH